MQNTVKARFALRRLPHVRLCTLRQLVLAQSQALTPFFTALYLSMILYFYKKGKTAAKCAYSQARGARATGAYLR